MSSNARLEKCIVVQSTRGEYKIERGCSEVVLKGAGNILKKLRVGALKTTPESTTMTRRICWLKKALLGGDANDIVLVFTTLVDESAGYIRFRRVGGAGNILLFVLLFD